MRKKERNDETSIWIQSTVTGCFPKFFLRDSITKYHPGLSISSGRYKGSHQTRNLFPVGDGHLK